MKNIAIIPARGGSKRLPNKNSLLLDGIPLIAHSIIYALNNKTIIDAVFVSTDDEKIKENRELLQQLIQKKGLKITGESTFLGYNAPYQFWSRKNEVVIPIEWKE